MIRSTEPTARARWMVWMRVELVGDLAELLGAHLGARLVQPRAQPLAGVGRRSRPPPPPAAPRPVGPASVRVSTSRANTTAGRRRAADHRRVRALDRGDLHASSFSRLENTTNAPPW